MNGLEGIYAIGGIVTWICLYRAAGFPPSGGGLAGSLWFPTSHQDSCMRLPSTSSQTVLSGLLSRFPWYGGRTISSRVQPRRTS